MATVSGKIIKQEFRRTIIRFLDRNTDDNGMLADDIKDLKHFGRRRSTMNIRAEKYITSLEIANKKHVKAMIELANQK